MHRFVDIFYINRMSSIHVSETDDTKTLKSWPIDIEWVGVHAYLTGTKKMYNKNIPPTILTMRIADLLKS